MKRLTAPVFIILFFSKISFGQTAKEVARDCLPSTVAVIMEDGMKQPITLGSGFILENGKVVTNLHVIEGAKYGYVLENGSSKKHSINGYFQVDKINDLAILSVPSLNAQPLIISELEMPEVGEKIYAIGSPNGLYGTISEGIVSGVRAVTNKSLIQITAPISPGSSGGPVINNKGEVVGVAVGALASGQNLNFAIPVKMVIELAKKCTSTTTFLNISKGSTFPKTSKDEIDIKEGVTIRNLSWGCHADFSYNFSIKNNLPSTISHIKVLILVYDLTGTIVNYSEKTLYYDGIRPFLAKTIDCQHMEFMDSYKKGYKLEARILDFKIVPE